MAIKVLDKHVAELIAAGEVVERPASVIKELVENSIDAGSSHITVEIKNGGITFMRITDDGCGIPHDQVPTAFLRHATSKVSSEDDLTSIATLGFRGEALASVSAVARVDMLTATTDGEGTSYSIHGGEEVSYEEAGCPKGTTIIVRDLFYNVPARMKFLKKDSRETAAVAQIMDRMALSHPEIAFRYISDSKVQMQTQGNGDLSAAVYSVYGRDFRSGLIPVDYSTDGFKLGGFICKPEAARKSRGMQHFFINGRYVNSNTMRAALEQAYKGSIMTGLFPSGVLFLRMDCSQVDINVHPAKLECRFTNEKPVFDTVYYGVKSALGGGYKMNEIKLTSLKPPTQIPTAEQTRVFDMPVETPSNPVQNPLRRNDYFQHIPAQNNPVRVSEIVMREPSFELKSEPVRKTNLDIIVDDEPVQVPSPAPKTEESEVVIQAPSEPNLENVDVTFVGEAFATYVLVEHGEELIIIDKHAAHERILYEKLKASATISSQLLLEPAAVTLSKDEYALIFENIDAITKAGFEIEEFGGSSVLVRAVPSVLTEEDVTALITEIASGLAHSKGDVQIDKIDWLYHNMACRAAIKGGDKSGKEDLLHLARRVALSDDIRYCPHGRPVAYKLTRKELEKQFGRLG